MMLSFNFTICLKFCFEVTKVTAGWIKIIHIYLKPYSTNFQHVPLNPFMELHEIVKTHKNIEKTWYELCVRFVFARNGLLHWPIKSLWIQKIISLFFEINFLAQTSRSREN